MSDLFQTLTTEMPTGEPVYCGYVLPGYIKQLGTNTIIHCHADRVSDQCGEHYEAAINLFSDGKPVPSEDGFTFDLRAQLGLNICVRGMLVDADGKPQAFLLEAYSRRIHRHLKVVA